MDRKELYENLQDIDAKITHLEAATLDIRETMIKLVKQGNQIVQFLKAFEVEDITDEYTSKSPLSVGFNQKDDKFRAMKDLVDDYLSKLERVHLKWHKHYEQMKEKFKAYAELIRSSKNLEQVIEVWSEAENVKHKITGTGTALALSSISESIIQQDMAERKLADTVAVVVTPKESVGV